MKGVNKVIIVGNLGQDPEVKTFQNGGKIANVSIATSERWTDKQTGEHKEVTEWHRIVFNDRLAEIVAQYLRKGSQVYIEGSLRTRKYQDQTGQDRYVTEIRADNMQILGSKPMSQNSGHGNQGYQQTNIQPPQQQWQQGYPQQQPLRTEPREYQMINGHPTTMPVSQPITPPMEQGRQTPNEYVPF